MVPRIVFVMLLAVASGMSFPQSALAQCSHCDSDVKANRMSFNLWHSFRSINSHSKNKMCGTALARVAESGVANSHYTLTRVPLRATAVPPLALPPAPSAVDESTLVLATENLSAENVVLSHQVSDRSTNVRDHDVRPDFSAKEFYEIARQLRLDAGALAKTTKGLSRP